MEITNSNGLGLMFFNSLKKYGDRVLLYDSDNDEAITYSEVLSQSIRTALYLKKKGITRNDIVCTCTHNQKYSCLPIIAAEFIGAISTNFDPTLSSIDTVHLLKLIQPKILFVSEEALDFMEKCIDTAGVGTELVVFGRSKEYMQFSDFLEADEDEKSFVPITIENVKDTAMILCSSGTTGLPKGICLSHYTLENGGRNFVPFRITKKNPGVSFTFATYYWISAHLNLICCITHGYATVFCKKFNPALTWNYIEKYKVTFTFLAPYNATACFQEKPANVDATSVEVVITGSCPVNKALMEDLINNFPRAKILNIYGQTEFGALTCWFDPKSEEEYKMQLLKPTSSGKIRDFAKWKVVDINTEKVVGPNEEGELRIKSDFIMNGYYKMDSSAAFDSEGYLKSGDILYYDEEECFFFADRIKEMFKYRGWHILPAIVENIVKLHPAVKDAAVIGLPHEIDGDHPMAVVELFDDFINTDPTEILNFVNERVSESQKLRAGVRILDSLPKTVTGKIRRPDLKKIILAQLRK